MVGGEAHIADVLEAASAIASLILAIVAGANGLVIWCLCVMTPFLVALSAASGCATRSWCELALLVQWD